MVTAPQPIPNDKPPIPRNKTKNMILKKGTEMSMDWPMPPSTPPSHLSVELRCMCWGFVSIKILDKYAYTPEITKKTFEY